MTTEATTLDGEQLLHSTYRDVLDTLPNFHLTDEMLAAIREQLATMRPEFERSGVVSHVDHRVAAPDGHEIVLRVYRPDGIDGTRPAIYGIHGGGYVLGTYEMLDAMFDRWCSRYGCIGISVEYRLAPEHPYPTPLEDCYTGLVWVREHHDDLGVDPDHIGIQGTSAGGGLAAALALLARDRGGPPIAFQVLECPMLDDRQHTPSSRLERLAVWSRESNEYGWRAYLGARYGTGDVPGHAAPARAEDLTGLPPAFVAVGGADGFRDEDVLYALRLAQAGVPTELHVYPGAPHGAALVPTAPAAVRWTRDVDDFVARHLGAREESRRPLST